MAVSATLFEIFNESLELNWEDLLKSLSLLSFLPPLPLGNSKPFITSYMIENKSPVTGGGGSGDNHHLFIKKYEIKSEGKSQLTIFEEEVSRWKILSNYCEEFVPCLHTTGRINDNYFIISTLPDKYIDFYTYINGPQYRYLKDIVDRPGPEADEEMIIAKVLSNKKIICNLLNGVRIIHHSPTLNYAYLNIRPENILINPQNNGILFTDFSVACQSTKCNRPIAFASPYRAPEVASDGKRYSSEFFKKADLFSLGNTIVHLLLGKNAYEKFRADYLVKGTNSTNIQLLVLEHLGLNMIEHLEAWAPGVLNLIIHLIDIDPDKRPFNLDQLSALCRGQIPNAYLRSDFHPLTREELWLTKEERKRGPVPTVPTPAMLGAPVPSVTSRGVKRYTRGEEVEEGKSIKRAR